MQPSSRRLAILNYLHRQQESGQLSERSLTMASMMADISHPLHETVIATNVAGHQEAETIYQAIETCQRQEQPPGGLSVVLGVNWPSDANKDNIPRTLAAIEQAQADFPFLDVRMIDQGEYEPDTPIGRIKKDLWDAIALAHSRTSTTNDLLIFNLDADLRKLTPSALTRTFAAYKARTIPRPFSLKLVHAHEKNMPRFNKLITLFDAAPYFLPTVVYSGSLALPLSFYCEGNGTDPTLKMSEMLDIVIPGRQIERILGALVTVSGRRALQAFSKGYIDPWANGFSLSERYREHPIETDLDPVTADVIQWRLVDWYEKNMREYFFYCLQHSYRNPEAEKKRLSRLTAICGLRLGIPQLNAKRIEAHYVAANRAYKNS